MPNGPGQVKLSITQVDFLKHNLILNSIFSDAENVKFCELGK